MIFDSSNDKNVKNKDLLSNLEVRKFHQIIS